MSLLIEVEIACPYCGKTWPLMVDTSAGTYAAIEDCSVCCRPFEVEVECEPGEVRQLQIGAN